MATNPSNRANHENGHKLTPSRMIGFVVIIICCEASFNYDKCEQEVCVKNYFHTMSTVVTVSVILLLCFIDKDTFFIDSLI